MKKYYRIENMHTDPNDHHLKLQNIKINEIIIKNK